MNSKRIPYDDLGLDYNYVRLASTPSAATFFNTFILPPLPVDDYFMKVRAQNLTMRLKTNAQKSVTNAPLTIPDRWIVTDPVPLRDYARINYQVSYPKNYINNEVQEE